MPSSQNKTTRHWRGILKAVRKNEAELAGVAPLLEALEKAYVQARALRSWRDTLRASSQDATWRLNEALAEGRDAEARLHHFLLSLLGPRSGKLPLLGIKAWGRRARTARKPGEDMT